MRKIFTFLLIIISSSIIFAQAPVIQGKYLPVMNTVFQQAWDTTVTDIVVSPPGEDQFWDYSTNFDNICGFTSTPTLPAMMSPFGSSFPTATHVTHAASVFGDSVYYYFTVDTIGFHIVGTHSFLPVYNINFTYSPTELFSFDEIHYLDMMNVNSRALGNFTYMTYAAKHYLNTTVHYEADAWGQLALPTATYSGVMRVKEMRTTIDSIFVDYMGFGSYTYLTKQTYTNERYHFMRNNTFGTTMLLQIGMPTSGFPGYAWYLIPHNTASISGNVKDSLGFPVTHGEAYLFRKCSNFTRDDVLDISIIDSYGHFQFDSIPHGQYLVGARPDPLYYENALFTYYGDTTSWLLADEVTLDGDVSGLEINICYHDSLNGNGSIAGFVIENLSYEEGSKGTKDFGEPVPGAEIYLEQEPEGEPIFSLPTDESGNFEIDDIPDGDYQLFVDIPGLNMSSTYEFSVLGGTVYGNLDFVMGSDSIFAVNEITGIIEKEGLSLAVFPNPASDFLIVEGVFKNTFVVIDEKGKVVKVAKPGNQKTIIDIKFLKKGLYFIYITDGEKVFAGKFIKE